MNKIINKIKYIGEIIKIIAQKEVVKEVPVMVKKPYMMCCSMCGTKFSMENLKSCPICKTKLNCLRD